MTHRVLRGLLGSVGLLVLAEILGRTGVVDTETLPLASTVCRTVLTLPGEPGFLSSLGGSVAVWAAGLGIAVAAAIPAGAAIGMAPLLNRLTGPLLELLRPIPPVALIPLALLAIGSTTKMSISLVAFACVWPILIHTIRGVRDADPLAVETLRAYGFGRMAVLRYVVLPSAAPFVVTGIRVAAAIALIVTITSELYVGAGRGLGTWLLLANSGPGQTHVILAAVAYTGALGLAADSALATASNRFLHWQPAARGSTT